MGVDQADGDGFDARGADLVGQVGQFGTVGGGLEVAVGRDALMEFVTVAPGSQGNGLFPGQVVQEGAAQPTELEDIPETLGGDQGRAGTASLKDGVGRHGGGVQHGVDLLGLGTGVGQSGCCSVEYSGGEVGGVERTLTGTTRPSGPRAMTSVKVPPISAPIRQPPSCSVLVAADTFGSFETGPWGGLNTPHAGRYGGP